MTRTWKAAIVVAIGVVMVAAGTYLAGSRESGTGGIGSREPEMAPASPGALATGAKTPGGSAVPGAGARGEPAAGTPSVETPDAAVAPPAAPSAPLAKPSASDLAHRQALANPRNPERWIEYAKALDSEGKPDLAVAALRRALHLGVNFEGRREVERLVREYDDFLKRGEARPPADRRAAPAAPEKPAHSRSR